MASVESTLPFLTEALWTATLLSMIPLVASMFVGLVISVLQAATQIQEQTLSFVPKLLVVLAALAVAGPWIYAKLLALAVEALSAGAQF